MDFNQLLSKMQEIESTPATEAVTDECGMNEMPPMTPPMPAPEKDKARMNINISAEGDAIDDVLKLMTKVNPDMMPKAPEPMPTLSIAPPMGPKPINKLIPDFDADNDDMPGGEKDMEIPAILDKGEDNDYDDDGKLDRHEKDHDEEEKLHKSVDRDNDGDHDMDDHDMEKDDDKKEAFANQPEEDYKDIEYLVKKLAGGMNRPKGTHPKVADGDNPMQTMEAEEQVEESKCEDCGCDPCECDDEAKNESNLRAQIRAELAQRLAEAKGEK
jgi:hypothetical protein